MPDSWINFYSKTHQSLFKEKKSRHTLIFYIIQGSYSKQIPTLKIENGTTILESFSNIKPLHTGLTCSSNAPLFHVFTRVT